MSLARSSLPATSRRTPQGEATVQRVLDAAEQLFAERGFAGTGLREVASAAGLRAPSLYNHFPNKEALYEAVLERALGPVLERLRAFLAAGADAYEEPRLVEDMMELLGRRPPFSRDALMRQTRFLRKLWHVVWKEPA